MQTKVTDAGPTFPLLSSALTYLCGSQLAGLVKYKIKADKLVFMLVTRD